MIASDPKREGPASFALVRAGAGPGVVRAAWRAIGSSAARREPNRQLRRATAWSEPSGHSSDW